MSALPRPDLAPGPARELNDALHELHHRAGWPSLRTLAGDAGCSHTTVSHVFSSPKLPTWGVIELLVEAMHGSTPTFHDLWLAASAPSSNGSSPTPRIAGRRSELVAVRRHLESGNGLLLVTGEAGMGKTKLVATAAASAGTFVATGTCRPLSTAVPLLPVSELFRQVIREDAAWFETALDDSPDYVRDAVARLLPELGSTRPGGVSEEWARQRLFHAISALLTALRGRRPLGVLIEDAHWGDTTTLDVLELLSGQPSPLVVTWRTDDPDVSESYVDWLSRVRRLPSAAILLLGPLTAEETAEQLTILDGRARAPDEVQRIYGRSLGQPLFTEQLALHPADHPLPELLAEVLLRRLRTLSPEAWTVARAMGVADRPLEPGQLALVTALDPVPALIELDGQRLLAPAEGNEARLRHPLVADAIRQRLVPGEAAQVHRDVACMLSDESDPPAAEIAQHWAAAGDATAELPWRIRAARAASASYAVESAANQWRRVLDLWPDDLQQAGDPPLTRAGMHIQALDAVQRLSFDAIIPQIDAALEIAVDAAPEDAAAILMRAGNIRGWLGDHDASLELGARALDIYADLPPCREHVVALHAFRAALEGVGRYREAAEISARAVTEAYRAGNPADLKEALAQRAWHQSMSGDTVGARASVDEMTDIVLEPPDPYCEIHVAVCVTDMLLMNGAAADELVEVARQALRSADTWGLHQWSDAILRYNVCAALIAQGDTRRAWGLIAAYTEGDPVQERWPLHEQRAVLEMLAGRTGAAQQQIAALTTTRLTKGGLAFRIEYNAVAAEIELWAGRAAEALDRSLPVLDAGRASEEPAILAPLLVLATRAAADLRVPAHGERLRELHRQLVGNPFAPHPMLVTPPAHGATWLAELARLDGAATVDQWTRAATAWDRLKRPHDSAYCRWRGAQVALREGQGTVASRLLKRAAKDAREHVPLSTAIRATFDGRT